MSLISRVPDYISELIPYPPGKPIQEVEREYGVSNSIKLASNECPLGPSPRAVEAINKVKSQLHIYPDGSGFYLKRKLSEKLDIHPENIILGNGSNEILELIARAFINKNDEAVMGDPAFIAYQLIVKSLGGKAVPVPLIDYTHDLKSMAEAVTAKTRVVFVANPNNPTGTVVKKEEMAAFFKAVPDDVLIVMDEAYYEYASTMEDFEDSISYLKALKNLIVLRTFSKAYGLAGLRAGYGIASKDIISTLERVRQPFNVNSLALAGAEAALDDNEHIARGLQVNSDGMLYLTSELKQLGLSYVESFANFLLIDVEMDGKMLSEALMQEGVIVRPMSGYGLTNHIRVTIGLSEENERCIKALGACIKQIEGQR
ncbi:MAG: histidinol-phosphate transaminase [Proteobacteria bacterium]|nr:histidinol-phosphate transaminase [Pseudomonadota bacterium]